MNKFPVIDGHCDTVLRLLQNGSSDLDALANKHISIKGLKEGGVILQFFAICPRCAGQCISIPDAGLKLADMYHLFVNRYSGDFTHIEKYDDIDAAAKSGKIGCLFSIEGGEAFCGELSYLRLYRLMGVRCVTLTWMYRNEIADGIMEKSAKGGLTDFGREVIKEMNRLGMLIDVSHISVKGFWDVVECSSDPIAATHSNAKKLCSHPRNLDDDQITAIKNNGGLIGINFYEGFLKDEGRAGIQDIVRHMEYIAALAGCGHLAFGTDFDGIDRLPEGVDGPSCFPAIAEELLRLNYKEEDVYKIFCGNYLRVLKSVLKNPWEPARNGELMQ